jgi:hypothetical protein
VNRAIQELDKVIQNNASAAEEMAATARELAVHSDHLLKNVSFFKVDAFDKNQENTSYGRRTSETEPNRIVPLETPESGPPGWLNLTPDEQSSANKEINEFNDF